MNVIKKILTNILIYGTEFIVIMLSVFPIVWVALSSFKTNAQILEGPFTLPTGITTAKEAYTYLFQKYDFFSYFGNSLMISLISTVISLVCFAMAAYVLAKYEFPGRNLIFALFTITMLVPGHAKAQPIFSLINSMHLYDTKTGLPMVLPFPCQWTELWDCNADEAILLSGITKKNCTLITIINIQFFFQIHISCI